MKRLLLTGTGVILIGVGILDIRLNQLEKQMAKSHAELILSLDRRDKSWEAHLAKLRENIAKEEELSRQVDKLTKDLNP
jgi:hypothetical protein